MTPDAALAAALFAVDPVGLGGVALRGAPGPARDAWMDLLRGLLPRSAPVRRIPLNTSDTSLLGGLDLGATLRAGRPVAQAGVLAQADGGIVVLPMAERMAAATAARLAAVLDTGQIATEREGLCLQQPARLGVVAMDEGARDDERVPSALLDRLAFHLAIDEGRVPEEAVPWQRADTDQARALLAGVTVGDELLQALCAAALALGVASLRAPLMAVRVARAAAALAGTREVGEEHAAIAARLVLAPRATQLPPAPPAPEEPAPKPPSSQAPDDAQEPAPQDVPADGPPDTQPQEQQEQPDQDAAHEPERPLGDSVLEAARAAIPAGLLAALKIGPGGHARAQSAGRAGAAQRGQTHGRPVGSARGEPRAGARLNLLDTLRAAAPWQALRRREAPANAVERRILVRKEDFHVTRLRQRGQTTTVFVVDASGSSALNRLAEAKGAVELLLADCYVRRDRVCVLAFRGASAELLLSPTRSLARAKRSLAALPGGGGTPLAGGLDAAFEMALTIRRRGETPIVVLLTDGRANIARNGAPGRVQAAADASGAARALRLGAVAALWIDTSPQPQAAARAMALEMGATYVPLPYAGAQAVSNAVRTATLALTGRG